MISIINNLLQITYIHVINIMNILICLLNKFFNTTWYNYSVVVNNISIYNYKIELFLLFLVSLMLFLIILNISSYLKIVKLITYGLSTLVIIEILNFNQYTNLEYFIFENAYKINSSTQILKITLLIIFIMFLSIIRYINAEKDLLLFLLIALLLAIILFSSNNLFLILITLECWSLLLYTLTFYKKIYGGIIAGTKYFIYGTLGSILIFWSIVNIYLFTGTAGLSELNDVFNNNLYVTKQVQLFLPMIFGFLIKLGIVPTYLWIADVYAGVPVYITAWFATIVKFVLIVVFWQITYHIISFNIIEIVSTLSILCGTYLTFKQIEIKKIIAYGSIIHTSFMLMGSEFSSSIYLITYIIATLVLFEVLIQLRVKNNKEIIYIEDLSAVRSDNRASMLLVIVFSSLAGLPPFAGFFGKFEVWKDLIAEMYINTYSIVGFFLIVSFILSLIIIFYYIRMLMYVFIQYDDLYKNDLSNLLQFNSSTVYSVFILIFWFYLQTFLF